MPPNQSIPPNQSNNPNTSYPAFQQSMAQPPQYPSQQNSQVQNSMNYTPMQNPQLSNTQHAQLMTQDSGSFIQGPHDYNQNNVNMDSIPPVNRVDTIENNDHDAENLDFDAQLESLKFNEPIDIDNHHHEEVKKDIEKSNLAASNLDFFAQLEALKINDDE